MSDSDLWTIRRVLQWTTGWFADRGLDSPRLDAEHLITHALDISRMQLYIDNHKPLRPEELAAIREGVRRRAGHEPIAYITGERGFWKHDLKVDARVLIPRPETELLVERVAARVEGIEAPTIVDVGTGSGCVALSVALDQPEATVIAVDISPDALDVAESNRQALEVDTVQLRHSDVLAAVPERDLDVVVSNPPYIPSADVLTLMPDVRDHEPHLALDGGADGLDIIRRLITQAAERLRPGGALLIEMGLGQGPAIEALLDADGRWTDVTLRPDLTGRDRVVEATRAP